MANSSDEEVSSDDSIDLNPLWRGFPFRSDPPTKKDEAETTPDTENAAGPSYVLELAPIKASASAPDNCTNTAETTTASAELGARQGSAGQTDVSVIPPVAPFMPAANSFYGQQDFPIPVLYVPPHRRQRRRVPDHFLSDDTPPLPKDSDDEGKVKAPKKDPRFVLPGAIREREEREDSEMDEATRSTRALRSEFVSELLMSSMTDRIPRANFKKLSGRFGTKNKKK